MRYTLGVLGRPYDVPLRDVFWKWLYHSHSGSEPLPLDDEECRELITTVLDVYSEKKRERGVETGGCRENEIDRLDPPRNGMSHDGHHTHLAGARVVCSCGEDFGTVTTDRVASDADVCEICRRRGVLAKDVRSAFRIPEPDRPTPMPLLTAEEAAAQGEAPPA